MNYAILALSITLALSVAANAFLTLQLKKALKAPPPVPTQEAKEVLAGLMQGQAIIRMQVLDPENLMLRSPRR
jgi:hypothetical protein